MSQHKAGRATRGWNSWNTKKSAKSRVRGRSERSSFWSWGFADESGETSVMNGKVAGDKVRVDGREGVDPRGGPKISDKV